MEIKAYLASNTINYIGGTNRFKDEKEADKILTWLASKVHELLNKGFNSNLQLIMFSTHAGGVLQNIVHSEGFDLSFARSYKSIQTFIPKF